MDGFANMERPVGGQSSVHCSSSSCRRGYCFSCFQGSVLWFLVFSPQAIWAVSERNTQIILNGTEVWNKTLQKDILHCSNFHEANVSSFFFYWPEDSFDYCCDGTSPLQNLTDFRYSMYGNTLNTATYYDLGLIDECLPYYSRSCHHLYDRYKEQPVYYTGCEWSDVIRLFQGRFWRLVVGKYGLLATALPLIGSLQLFVFLAIALEVVYWRYWHSREMDNTDMSFVKLKKISKRWVISSWKNACMDWLHLCLLSIIGNGLVEAVGRTDPYGWQAKTFYRYSIVYLALSVILWFSSFLHQVTQWIAVDKKVTIIENENMKKKTSMVPDGAAEEGTLQHSSAGETRVQIDQNDSNTSGTTGSNESQLDPAIISELRKLLRLDKNKDPVAQLRKLLQLGPDWKWQPIAAQTAILFCLWAYLTYPNGEDGLSSTLLGFLVQAASPWSGLYACRVLFLTLPFLLKKVFDVKHVRHLLRSRQSTLEGSGNKPKEGPPKAVPEWLQWGRVLCCLGCCWRKPEGKRGDSSSSSSSDSD